jgi:hypothetical protein
MCGKSFLFVCFRRAWDVATWTCTQTFVHENTVPLSIAATERGVVSGSADGKIRHWQLDEYKR